MNSNISPKFEWSEFAWEAVVNFPDWSGLQERNGPYGAVSSQTPSNGDIKIVFAPEGRGDEPLNENEMKLINWFITNQKSVINTILSLIFTSYPTLKKLYIEELGDEVIEFFPDVNSLDDLKKLIGLVFVHIHQVSKDNIPYIGIELGCDWEEEHGYGILLHGDKVIEVGGADTAILLWMAEKHANET